MPHEHFHRPHLALFGNREVTSLYVMLAILSFAASLIGVFVPVFLYETGFAIWEILLFYFLRSAWFLVLAVALIPVLKRISDKMMMSLSIPFLILFFLGLSRLDGPGFLFWALPACVALYMLLFWNGFHLDFSGSADEDKVGREVGMRNMFMMLANFAGPLAGGALIVAFGFSMTFVIGSMLLLLALVPLFFFPSRKMPEDMSWSRIWSYIKSPKTAAFRTSAIGFANEKMATWIVWPLFVFIAIGSVEKFGALYSFGFLLAAVMTFLMGKMTDHGSGKRIMRIFVPFEALIWVLKAIARSAGFAAVMHVVSEVNFSALRVPWGSGYYRIARKMATPGTFIYAMELVFNGARVLYLPLLMLAAYHLPTQTFLRAGLLLTPVFTLMYLASNRQSYRFEKEE